MVNVFNLEQVKVFLSSYLFHDLYLTSSNPDPIFTKLRWMVYFMIHTFICITGLNAESKPKASNLEEVKDFRAGLRAGVL